MRALVVIAAVLFASVADGAVRRRSVRQLPVTPAGCTDVGGLTGVYRSTDGGATFSGNRSSAAIDALFAIHFLEDPPDTVVAASLRTIYDSLDHGCTWTRRYEIPLALHHPVAISHATGGRAFVWSDEILLRYDHSEITRLTPPLAIGALGVNPGNRDHVRILTLIAGEMWDSFDGGETWTRGTGPAVGVRGAAFHPNDFDHILVVAAQGLMETRDGGRQWTGPTSHGRTLCSAQFVRHMPNVVWLSRTIGAGDELLRADGGSQFQTVGALPISGDADGACIPFEAHPFDSNRAVVAFDTIMQIDAAARSVSSSPCCGGARAFRVAISPSDRELMLVFATPR